jgi:hypothetical protein
VNFTREPIIETIITPKDGFRLTLRNSKVASSEEYSVEALEVVSFGNAQFFRSQEKPKAFLLPIADYEIVETREAKIVLKNPAIEKTIKIAGGKEPLQKVVKAEPVEIQESQEASEEDKEPVFEKRKDKKKNRRKKAQEQRQQEREKEIKEEDKGSLEPHGIKNHEAEAPALLPPIFSSLLPPPPTLISETIARYKAMESSENFMINKQPQLPTETPEVDLDVDNVVLSDDDALDQIWAFSQKEETFSSEAGPGLESSSIEEAETTAEEPNARSLEDSADDIE